MWSLANSKPYLLHLLHHYLRHKLFVVIDSWYQASFWECKHRSNCLHTRTQIGSKCLSSNTYASSFSPMCCSLWCQRGLMAWHNHLINLLNNYCSSPTFSIQSRKRIIDHSLLPSLWLFLSRSSQYSVWITQWLTFLPYHKDFCFNLQIVSINLLARKCNEHTQHNLIKINKSEHFL